MRHDGEVGGTVASQQEGSVFKPRFVPSDRSAEPMSTRIGLPLLHGLYLALIRQVITMLLSLETCWRNLSIMFSGPSRMTNLLQWEGETINNIIWFSSMCDWTQCDHSNLQTIRGDCVTIEQMWIKKNSKHKHTHKHIELSLNCDATHK